MKMASDWNEMQGNRNVAEYKSSSRKMQTDRPPCWVRMAASGHLAADAARRGLVLDCGDGYRRSASLAEHKAHAPPMSGKADNLAAQAAQTPWLSGNRRK